jgi:hypothetical protein
MPIRSPRRPSGAHDGTGQTVTSGAAPGLAGAERGFKMSYQTIDNTKRARLAGAAA